MHEHVVHKFYAISQCRELKIPTSQRTLESFAGLQRTRRRGSFLSRDVAFAEYLLRGQGENTAIAEECAGFRILSIPNASPTHRSVRMDQRVLSTSAGRGAASVEARKAQAMSSVRQDHSLQKSSCAETSRRSTAGVPSTQRASGERVANRRAYKTRGRVADGAKPRRSLRRH